MTWNDTEKRLTYKDKDGRARLTNYGMKMYCSTQATADILNDYEERLIPRVLSRNEICELAWNSNHPVLFVEMREINYSCPYPIWFEGYAEPVESDETEIHLYGFGAPEPCEAKWRDYCKIWRCWDKEPSEKQMAETPWDEGKGEDNEAEN